MCGIFLVKSKHSLNKDDCINSSNLIKSRGPDYFLQKFFFKEKLYISNSVLSISGKYKKKQKELNHSKNKNLYISYNGEIFNWQDITKKENIKAENDTQMILQLAEKCKKTNFSKNLFGMFAIILFDKKKNKIFFYCDPQGEKKLFYYNHDGNFIISSSIKPIINYLKKNDLDVSMIKDYFNTRHFMFYKKTIYKNIFVTEPGKIYEFNLKSFKLSEKFYDNPINWINEKLYKSLNENDEIKIKTKLKTLLETNAKLMVSKHKFGSIFSGGIDSSLQSALINNYKKPNTVSVLNFLNKDKITKNIFNFNKYINFKIDRLSINKKKFIKNFKACYNITGFPFLTHDFVGKYMISKYFRSNGCKVFFGADGVDELFGGYEIYKKTNWGKIPNPSPYTAFNDNIKNKKSISNSINSLWNRVYKKYSFIKNKKERSMQASFFLDYFIQSVYVGNIGTDIMCSHNGIEPRNIFIKKNIIKFAINLPVRFKINLKKKSNLRLKYIIKKIFLDFFPNKLIFKKQGFSGFPNEAKHSLLKKNYKNINKILNHNFKFNSNINRATEWKIINLELFLKFSKKYYLK